LVKCSSKSCKKKFHQACAAAVVIKKGVELHFCKAHKREKLKRSAVKNKSNTPAAKPPPSSKKPKNDPVDAADEVDAAKAGAAAGAEAAKAAAAAPAIASSFSEGAVAAVAGAAAGAGAAADRAQAAGQSDAAAKGIAVAEDKDAACEAKAQAGYEAKAAAEAKAAEAKAAEAKAAEAKAARDRLLRLKSDSAHGDPCHNAPKATASVEQFFWSTLASDTEYCLTTLESLDDGKELAEPAECVLIAEIERLFRNRCIGLSNFYGNRGFETFLQLALDASREYLGKQEPISAEDLAKELREFAFVLTPRMWTRLELLLIMFVIIDPSFDYFGINQKVGDEPSQNR